MKVQDRFAEQLAEMGAGAPSLVENSYVFNQDDTIPVNQVSQAIILGRDVPVPLILKTLSDGKVSHFVQSSRPDFFYEVMLSCILMNRPEFFLKDPQPLLHAKGGAGGANAQGKGERRFETISFRASSEKSGLIDQVANFANKSTLTQPFLDRCLMIADELIANALFNAPIDSVGRPVYRQTPRETSVSYPSEKESGRFFISSDSRRLLLGCFDPYGSVDREEFLTKLRSSYGRGGMAIPKPGAGAGLGCRFMLESSSEFYAVVRPRKLTLLCCSFAIDKGQRAIELLPKHIHVDIRK